MAFVIFYNHADLTPIVAEIGNPNLTGADKQLAGKLWNGGVKNWANAPVETNPDISGGDPDCRRLLVDAQGVTLADAVALLRRIAANIPGAQFMQSIADDMENTGQQL